MAQQRTEAQYLQVHDPMPPDPCKDPMQAPHERLTLDDLLQNHVGELGWGQIFILAITSLCFLPVGIILLLMVFDSLDPVTAGLWACYSPADTQCQELHAISNTLNSMDTDFCTLDNDQYYWTDPGYSIISTFDLTCKQGFKVTLVNSLFFAGLALGGCLFGVVSDNYGRRTALFTSTALGALTVTMSAVTSTYWQHFVSDALHLGLASVQTRHFIHAVLVNVLCNHISNSCCHVSMLTDGVMEQTQATAGMPLLCTFRSLSPQSCPQAM